MSFRAARITFTQRGNNRHDVFFVDDDRRLYLEMPAEECDTHGLEVLAY